VLIHEPAVPVPCRISLTGPHARSRLAAALTEGLIPGGFAVNRKLLLAALIALLVVVVQERIQGTPADESAGGDEAPFPVALVNLSKIYKQHERFADLSEKMRAEVTAAEQELKGQRAAYETQAKELERHKKGTAEYDRLSAELVKLAETLNAQVNRQKEAFLQQESAIYLEVFEQIEAAIQEYADKRGIKLVLRIGDDSRDRTKPAELLKELNKSVIYHQGIDITNGILEMMNGRK
jgi:Skp family chaperone for outer membrane proteins